MGQLKIVPGGLQLNGQALFLNALRASSIRSRHGQPMTIGRLFNLFHIFNDCIKRTFSLLDLINFRSIRIIEEFFNQYTRL